MLHKRGIARKFKNTHGFSPSFTSPQTLLEKLQTLNLSPSCQDLAFFVDKYLVRHYVEAAVGKQLLIPLLGVYNAPSEINPERLPKACVIKMTHASGMNLIVPDKGKIDWNGFRRIIRSYGRRNYFTFEGEYCYKKCQPKIVVEKFMGNNGQVPVDFKFWCVNGKCKFISVFSERFDDLNVCVTSPDWQPLPILYTSIRNATSPGTRPPLLEKLITLAERLAAPFTFVRVDLYEIEGQPYFGELTFTPGAGLNLKIPRNLDEQFGQNLDGFSFFCGSNKRQANVKN